MLGGSFPKKSFSPLGRQPLPAEKIALEVAVVLLAFRSRIKTWGPQGLTYSLASSLSPYLQGQKQPALGKAAEAWTDLPLHVAGGSSGAIRDPRGLGCTW